nr:MAG TPA: hypothetical protein [Caudoviricetes sp.]
MWADFLVIYGLNGAYPLVAMISCKARRVIAESCDDFPKKLGKIKSVELKS